MPYPSDPSSPATLRYSRTSKTKVAATAALGGVFTVASGALDAYQSGDLCALVDAVDGTPYTGVLTAGQGVTRGQVLVLEKLSATTAQLHLDSPAGAVVTFSTALSAGGALQFGGLPSTLGQVSGNIVAAGSVKGGAYGGPLD